jgi:hypothetical protein
MRNRGVIIETRKTDYFVGGESSITYQELNPNGDWSLSLPSTELQWAFDFDTMACVTFAALNSIEIQINYMIKNGLISPENLAKLNAWGFIDANGEFNCSDRFTAKVSGTTKQGNSGQRVWDSIREHTSGFGLVPEAMWPWDRSKSFSWDQYYAEIPQDVLDFAKKIWEVFEFKYEYVSFYACNEPMIPEMQTALKQAPLEVFTKTCNWSLPVITRCGTDCIPNHATVIYGIDQYFRDYDHYKPTQKLLSLDFQVPFVLKGVVSQKKPTEVEIVTHVFNKDIIYLERSDEVMFLQKALKQLEFLKVNPTGYYWENTRIAVLNFQIQYKLLNWYERYILRGKRVGPKTRAKLNEILDN